MVDGVRGGRSTHGICFGALAWLVEDGHVGEVDVSGLAAVLVVRYDDDEPGSPWTTGAIELVPDGDGYVLRVGDAVRARATRPAFPDSAVRCGIPGYDEPGRELLADELVVHDDPFSWELTENCAFASRFAYASE
jgi:uncharacterized protein DUF1326